MTILLAGQESTMKIMILIFTTHELRTFNFNKYLQDLQSSGKAKIKHNLVILHSNRSAQVTNFMSIKKDHGTFSNPDLDALFSEGRGVPSYRIVKEMSQLKFYDWEPPVIYTMIIIWDFVLKPTLPQHRLLRGNTSILVEMSVEQIRDALLHFAPQNNRPKIRKDWVKRALLGFEEIDVTQPVDKSKELFKISSKVIRAKKTSIGYVTFSKRENPSHFQKRTNR